MLFVVVSLQNGMTCMKKYEWGNVGLCVSIIYNSNAITGEVAILLKAL